MSNIQPLNTKNNWLVVESENRTCHGTFSSKQSAQDWSDELNEQYQEVGDDTTFEVVYID